MKTIIPALLFLAMTQAAPAESLRPQMNVLANDLIPLMKLLGNQAEFLDPKNEKLIDDSIQKMEQHVGAIQKSAPLKSAGLKVNAELMKENLAQARNAFKLGDKTGAEFALQDSLNNCITCHIRTKSEDRALPDIDLSKLDPFRQGNFLFATKQFDKGKTEYEYTVEKFSTHKNHTSLIRSLVTLLGYYVNIKEDPASAAVYFTKVSDNTKLPEYVRNEIKMWVEDLKGWQQEKKSTVELTEQQLLNKAKELLVPAPSSILKNEGRKFLVRRLRARSLLYKLMEIPPMKSAAKAEAIYLLGLSFGNNNQSYYTYHALIFKTCINEYPKSDMAKKCFSEFERVVLEGNYGRDALSEKDAKELASYRSLAY